MIYLDHAASTPLRPPARAALDAVLDAEVGNGSAAHAAGRAAREAVEVAREQVANSVGADPIDVVFTSGGTESDNLAIKGLAWAAPPQRRGIVVSAIEHPAVMEPAVWLAKRGGHELTVVGVDRYGRVDPDELADHLDEGTAVVSVMLANNELGTIQQVRRMADAAHEVGAVFHTDAVQAAATMELDMEALGCDAISIAGHKFGAPQGVGALVCRRGVPIEPLAHGGGQDRGVRSGTLAAALDAALGAGLSAAVQDRGRLVASARSQTDRLAAALEALGGIRRNGPREEQDRLATHCHLSIDGVTGDELIFGLDRAGVAASAGAACGSGALKASPVVEAAGIDGDATLRLSVGWSSTDAEVDEAAAIVAEVISALRAGRPVAA